jgi:hypothetical protein
MFLHSLTNYDRLDGRFSGVEELSSVNRIKIE